MIFSLLPPLLLGLLAGIITGLTPGIHINLVSLLLVGSAPFLLGHFSLMGLAVFIIAMSVVHTFLDSLPSIFLGAPDAATALGVLPGHRYLLQGWGMMAVKLTIIGSLGAAMLSVFFFPLFVWVVEWSYPLFSSIMGWLLLAVAIFMVVRDKKRLWAALIFLLSGSLGVIVLNMETLENPLFPMLSGLFGISTLLISLNESTEIPPQQTGDPEIKVRPWIAVQALLSGQFSGFLTAMLPGLGSATAAVLSLQITRNLGDHGYMLLQGSIGTVNFILSLATLLVLEKARNGAVISIMKLVDGIGLGHILLFLAVTLLAAGIGALLALYLGKAFATLIGYVNYKALVIGIIVFLVILTPIMSSWTGMLVLVTATGIGLLPATVKTARVHGMGCILLPVMLFFLL
jgi:putative membrane protein